MSFTSKQREITYYEWLGWAYRASKIDREVMVLNINRASNRERAKAQCKQGVDDFDNGVDREKYRRIK